MRQAAAALPICSGGSLPAGVHQAPLLKSKCPSKWDQTGSGGSEHEPPLLPTPWRRPHLPPAPRCQGDRLPCAGCQGEQLKPLGLSTRTHHEDIILWQFILRRKPHRGPQHGAALAPADALWEELSAAVPSKSSPGVWLLRQ